MADNSSFESVFARLKAILQAYEPLLRVETDAPDNYYLNTPYSEAYQKEIFFGSAQIKKNYVSYYLMPVYWFPDLLDGISPELKKHMQGKSCFNFKAVNDDLLRELAALTEKGIERFREGQYL